MTRLKKYLILTFSITWVLWMADALLVKYTAFRERDVLPMLLFTGGGFGPTIAAILCIEPKRSLKNIMDFILGGNPKAVLLLLLFIALEWLTFGMASGERNAAVPLSAVPMVLLGAVTVYGGNEELGWRGIMQPDLQSKFSYPVATLMVGCVWAVWHLPLWLIEGNSHQGTSFVAFAILAILLSFWLAAIRTRGGSVLHCMILHGVSNTILSAFVVKTNWILILGCTIMTAVAVWVSMKDARA